MLEYLPLDFSRYYYQEDGTIERDYSKSLVDNVVENPTIMKKNIISACFNSLISLKDLDAFRL